MTVTTSNAANGQLEITSVKEVGSTTNWISPRESVAYDINAQGKATFLISDLLNLGKIEELNDGISFRIVKKYFHK